MSEIGRSGRLWVGMFVLRLGVQVPFYVAEQAAALASTSVAPISDLRSTAGYRRRIVGVYVKRLLTDLGGDS